MENQQIVFAYWHNNEFKGYRMDTFGSVGRYPKVYTYSPTQVQTVMDNIRCSCNNVGKTFFQDLSKITPNVITTGGYSTPIETVIKHVSNTEKTFREWGEFEVRVHPFNKLQELQDLDEGEEWKLDKILADLEPAIEIQKFKIVNNEN